MSPEAAQEDQRSDHVEFRGDVEGLRALAVVLVVVYHAWRQYCSGGFVGVDVFFVISGFLITRQLVGEIDRRGHVSFSRFYARRARRILPAAALVSVVTVAVSGHLLAPLAARSVYRDALTTAVFGMNYRLAILRSDYLNASVPVSPLQHYWSLSVEEQFYFVWPALLAAGSLVWLKRRSKRGAAITLTVIAAGSLSASLWFTPASPTWAYYSLWTRGWELAVGGLVCLSLPRLRRLPQVLSLLAGWAGLAAIVASGLAFHDSTPFPGFAALAPVLGAAAVIAAGSADRRPRRGVASLLTLGPAQFVGRLSYSLYLWHLPVIVLAPYLVGHPLNSSQMAAAVLLSIVLALASFLLVEQPVRRMPGLVTRPSRGLMSGVALAGVVVVAASVATSALPSLRGRGPAAHLVAQPKGLTLAALQGQLVAALARQQVPVNLIPPLSRASSNLPIVYHDGCHVGQASTGSPPCVFADATSQITVVLFGDSHAAEWFPALETIAAEDHWRLISLTKSGCPPVDVTVRRPGLAVPYTTCNPWRQYALRRIAATRPSLVVVSWDRALSKKVIAGSDTPAGYSTVWLAGVVDTLRSLRSSAGQVAFIMDTPHARSSVPTCLSAHLNKTTSCNPSRNAPVDQPALGVAEAQAANGLGVHVINPIDWFCTPTGCPAVVGNILVYRDADHMVPQYSQLLAPLLRRNLPRLTAGH